MKTTGQHYNTTNEKGNILNTFQKKADGQTNVVLNYFKSNHNKEFTPSDIWTVLRENDLIGNKTPITSIRRTITDLTIDDKLVKLDKKKNGIFGRPEHFWKLLTTTIDKNGQFGIDLE